jgi:copper oxidase (laccase) domain-containing protein
MSDLHGIIFATSTREDGNMGLRFGPEEAVRTHREIFLARYGISPEACAVMECEHGLAVEEAHAGSLIRGDALISNVRGCCLFLLTADCIPLALIDETHAACALIHASRKTIAGGLIAKCVRALEASYGVEPGDLKAVIGPHIRKHSYAFDLPLASIDDAIAPYISYENGRAHIGLTDAALAQLTASGIAAARIEDDGENTYSGPYFSHYRAMRDPLEREGRVASILVLP